MTERKLKPVNPNNPYIKSYVAAVEKGMKDPHVIPDAKNWIVKTFSSSEPYKIEDSKDKAITSAYVLAKSTGSDSIIIHSKSGGIIRRAVPAR